MLDPLFIDGLQFVLAIFLGAMFSGWLVGWFVTVQGNVAKVFDIWPFWLMFLIMPIIIETVATLSVLKYGHRHYIVTFEIGCGLVAFILFIATFMRCAKKRPAI